MKRLGHCNHCGFCCEYTILATFDKTKKLTKDEERYLMCFDACAVPSGENVYLLIKHVCKFYDTTIKRCKNYLDRPKACRTFPERPDNPYLSIMDKWGVKCGYRFVEDE